MTGFAVYDETHICGIGDTPDAAIADAKTWLLDAYRDYQQRETDYGLGHRRLDAGLSHEEYIKQTCGIDPATDRLIDAVENGFYGAFRLNSAGLLDIVDNALTPAVAEELGYIRIPHKMTLRYAYGVWLLPEVWAHLQEICPEGGRADKKYLVIDSENIEATRPGRHTDPRTEARAAELYPPHPVDNALDDALWVKPLNEEAHSILRLFFA